MKIVNILLTSQNGGAEQVFIDYCNILKNKLGHEVFAIIKSDAPYNHKLIELGIRYQVTNNKFGYADLVAINNIKKFLIDFDADVVLTHNSRANDFGRKAVNKIKNKKVFHIAVNHSMNVKRSIGADIVLSVNKPIFYRTIDLGQPNDRSFIVSNGINLNNFTFKEKRLNFKDKETITFGVMGRFVIPKGFDSAIKMLKILKSLEKKYNKKFALKVAGDGEERENLRKLVKKLKLNEDVEFLGWVKNHQDFFDAIDIFILTSHSETFGLVLLESMKYQTPIISTNVDGPKEVLRDGKDALLVELKPIQNLEVRLVDAVEKLISDDELANKFIKNTQERILNKFSFDAVAKSLGDIIGFIAR